MAKTRREFLQSSTALAIGVVGGASIRPAAAADARAETPALPAAGSQAGAQGSGVEIQIPKMKFGGVELSRLVLGVNPFYGWSHYNANYNKVMSDWYTQDKVCEVMHRANSYGINGFNYVNAARAQQDWARFQAEGGAMHLIIQVTAKDDAETLVKTLKPLALQRQGEVVDIAFKQRTMDTVREWCKKVRDMGVLVGVGTHKPEVIQLVEEQGWDVDFYAGCVYNRTRTETEWKQTLSNELPEMAGEIYLRSDPARMYQVIRQTAKPCFAFKILAAGRIGDNNVEQAFRTAYQNIKPTDGIYVGMFPYRKDEVKENAETVYRILTGA